LQNGLCLTQLSLMTQRKIKPGAIETDVDLDNDVVYLADGRRLTEQVAVELAQRALARHGSRPTVTGEGVLTPSLTIRVPPEPEE
jgi:hypothetical protein